MDLILLTVLQLQNFSFQSLLHKIILDFSFYCHINDVTKNGHFSTHSPKTIGMSQIYTRVENQSVTSFMIDPTRSRGSKEYFDIKFKKSNFDFD